jgi:tripartite ATP-independent transporter DctM subunit
MGFGVITPTEVGIFASVYALLLGVFYRESSRSELFECLKKSVLSTCLIMYIIAVSTVAGWIYAFEGTPQLIAEWMLNLTGNKYIVLLLMNIFLLVLGCLLEPIPVLLLATPIFMPILTGLGVDLVHFGIVMNLNITIGIITPPMGIGLYVMQSVADIKFEPLVKACLPFLIPLILCLLLFTYLPELTLFLPDLLMGKPS